MSRALGAPTKRVPREPTARPWEVRVTGSYVAIVAPKPSKDWPAGELIAKMASGRPNLHANAELIVAAVEAYDAAPDADAGRPVVTTLCGSTRFKAAYIDWYQRLTDAGHIVLSVGRYLPRPQHAAPIKAKLDELHLRKIDLSDEIFVIDVGGYVGQSTIAEIGYAQVTGKRIRYLSNECLGYQEPDLRETDIGAAVLDADASRVAELEREKGRRERGFKLRDDRVAELERRIDRALEALKWARIDKAVAILRGRR